MVTNSNRVIKHDPNGLIQRDVLHLRKVFKSKPYTPKMTHAEIMYEEGIQKVLDYIERELVAKVHS